MTVFTGVYPRFTEEGPLCWIKTDSNFKKRSIYAHAQRQQGIQTCNDCLFPVNYTVITFLDRRRHQAHGQVCNSKIRTQYLLFARGSRRQYNEDQNIWRTQQVVYRNKSNIHKPKEWCVHTGGLGRHRSLGRDTGLRLRHDSRVRHRYGHAVIHLQQQQHVDAALTHNTITAIIQMATLLRIWFICGLDSTRIAC